MIVYELKPGMWFLLSQSLSSISSLRSLVPLCLSLPAVNLRGPGVSLSIGHPPSLQSSTPAAAQPASGP